MLDKIRYDVAAREKRDTSLQAAPCAAPISLLPFRPAVGALRQPLPRCPPSVWPLRHPSTPTSAPRQTIAKRSSYVCSSAHISLPLCRPVCPLLHPASPSTPAYGRHAQKLTNPTNKAATTRATSTTLTRRRRRASAKRLSYHVRLPCAMTAEQLTNTLWTATTMAIDTVLRDTGRRCVLRHREKPAM
jgi:hypothetical protein